MITNTSVPADIVLPHLVYGDVAAAAAWLAGAFGFVEHFRYGPEEAPQGMQMRLGAACIMLACARPGRESPAALGAYTQMLTVFVENLEGHLARARTAGAEIVEPLNETSYGDLQYGAKDLEGHVWLFAHHARDVRPEEWGATTAR